MQLFTLTEAARFLKVPSSQVRALIAAGKLGYVHVGGHLRIRCDHLIKFIREHTRQGSSEWLSKGT